MFQYTNPSGTTLEAESWPSPVCYLGRVSLPSSRGQPVGKARASEAVLLGKSWLTSSSHLSTWLMFWQHALCLLM